MSNRADTEFVFREECWIERNFVPIGKSPSCFQTYRLRAAASIEPLELRFCRYVKTIGQTHLDLLGEQIIWRPVAESLALEKFAEEKCPWRQHVGIYCVGETAARKCRRRTVRAGHFLDGWDPTGQLSALLLLVPERSDLTQKTQELRTQLAESTTAQLQKRRTFFS